MHRPPRMSHFGLKLRLIGVETLRLTPEFSFVPLFSIQSFFPFAFLISVVSFLTF